MFSWLKKHFIPHEGNNHRPHILRDTSISIVIIVVLIFEVSTFLLPALSHINTTGGMAAVLPAVLSDLTNQQRETQSLATLTVSPLLTQAAQMKAEDMATKGYFAHTSPDGKTPWYWLEQVGYQYQYAGENLAINFTDSKDVVNAWIASPEHEANLVKENYTQIGTAVANGMYEGRETIFVVQLYANPLPLASLQPAIESQKPIAVKVEKNTNTSSTNSNPTDVLGAEVAPVNTINNVVSNQTQLPTQTTFWQRLLASPRDTTNIILYIAFGLVLIALLLYLGIRLKNYHMDLLANGLMALAIIGTIFVMNYYFSYHRMLVTNSFDYSNQNKS
jgi:hypothetical protein